MRKIVFVVWALALALITVQDVTAQVLTPKPHYQLQTPFDHEAFEWSQDEGTGVIAGRASLVAQGGFIQYPEDQDVILVPRNAYTDEIVEASRQPGFFETYLNVEKHPDYAKYRRVHKPDPTGHFRFENLPAGEWYVATTIIWYTRDQLGVIAVNGGVVWGLIHIKDGEIRDDIHLNSIIDIAN